MTDASHTPVQTAPQGAVADAVPDNWVDVYAPAWTRPYLRLSRADRPIGTWLLLIPCLWGVLLSGVAKGGLGWHGLWIITGCTVGAFLMRGAGCTWNDITDREFDASVTRTKSRPLPSGQVKVKSAVIWMCAQAILAFFILLTFNLNAILLGIASLGLVCLYPFAKRFTWWPQMFLGLAFNWGALLAWTAHSGQLEWPAVALYLAGIFWTLFYDTIYAHQDREDDALIGVKSTARLFGDNTHAWLLGFEVFVAIGLIAATSTAFGPSESWLALAVAYAGIGGFVLHMENQRRQLDINNPLLCLRLFQRTNLAGKIFAGSLVIALLV
ncbi:MAG: 4-hydroxybenzoate octaprenyltransferase [Pseudomonadota bacterium]